jgi:predicted NBD/HSP70 family sugar kinase
VEQIQKRNRNREAILRALHFEGPLQRSELSDRLRIRKSSVTSIGAELLRTGLAVEQEPGRPRSPLRLEPSSRPVVAVRLTRQAVHVASVALDGTVTGERSYPLRGDTRPDRTIDLLARAIAPALKGARRRPLGAGVSLPGLIDPLEGVVRYTAAFEGWRDVPLAAELARRIRVPVRIDNDVRCQLWSSAWFDRLLREFENLLYVAVTDGVACALIVHGRRVLGGCRAAGEIGHVRAGSEGRLCACGKTDCLETYCSLPAVREEIRALRPGTPAATASDLALRAANDPVQRGVLDRAAARLAQVLAPLMAAIDPDAVVLGSGAREFSDLLRQPLEHALRAERVGLEPRQAVLRVAEPEPSATLKGIAGLVIEDAFRSGSCIPRTRRQQSG